MSYPEHGGNIYYFANRLDVQPFEIIDMSASVNPLTKDFLKEAISDPYFYIQFYPDPDCSELRKLLCEKLQTEGNSILFANGSMELIKDAILWFLPKGATVLLPQPTFTAYRKFLNLRKDLLVLAPYTLNPSYLLDLVDQFLEKNYPNKVVILCNPNNPTCWTIKKSDLLQRINQNHHTLFLIDEAFIDFCEEESLAHLAPTLPNLIVFRSLTKFYGLAGTRIGYLIANEDIIHKLKRFQTTWQVNTLSQVFASFLLKNQLFKKISLDFFSKELKKFERTLKDLGIWHRIGVVNFVFFRLERGEEFWQWLLREERILIRTCSNFEGLNGDYLRVSVKESEANDRFLTALVRWLRPF